MSVSAVVDIHIDFDDSDTYDLAGTFEMELVTDWYRCYDPTIPVTIRYYPAYDETDSAIELELYEVHSGYNSYWSQLVEDETNVITFDDPVAGAIGEGDNNGTASGSVSITGYLTTVPNVVGLTRNAAETAIVNAYLTVGDISEVHSETIEEGLVISQLPGAGSVVDTGTPVSLLMSLGLSIAPPKATTPGPSNEAKNISRLLSELTWEVPEA
ncbi:MAG: PASTA domain-containing protein [Patescibacteria group bacterium]|jgi:hypothetical protein